MVKIDEKKCVGCGACAVVCPDGFEVSNGKVKFKDSKAECIDEAIDGCPVNAISR